MGYFDSFDFEQEIEGKDTPSYDELTEEEIVAREEEFRNMSVHEKELFKDITGQQNTHYIKLDLLLNACLDSINAQEDTIEDITFSDQFMRFLNFLDSHITDSSLYTTYGIQVDNFEKMFNDNMPYHTNNEVVTYFQKKIIDDTYTDTELGSIENRLYTRFEMLTNTKKDLVEIFKSLTNNSDRVYTWDYLESLL